MARVGVRFPTDSVLFVGTGFEADPRSSLRRSNIGLYENFHRGNLSICCVFVADLSSSTALYSPLLPPLPTPLCPLAAGGGGFYKGNLCCVFPALQRGVYRLFFSLFLRLIFFPYTVLVHHLQPVLLFEGLFGGHFQPEKGDYYNNLFAAFL